MKVRLEDISRFIEDHNLSPLCQTEDEMVTISDASLSGKDEVETPDDYWSILVARDSEMKAKQAKWDAEYSAISLHRKAGMECEANGDIDEAINEYAESIRLGENAENDMFHAFGYSYTRIIVLLDKVKRFAKEIDYIEAVLNHSMKDSERGKYAARLEKTKVKLVKQSNDGRI